MKNKPYDLYLELIEGDKYLITAEQDLLIRRLNTFITPELKTEDKISFFNEELIKPMIEKINNNQWLKTNKLNSKALNIVGAIDEMLYYLNDIQEVSETDFQKFLDTNFEEAANVIYQVNEQSPFTKLISDLFNKIEFDVFEGKYHSKKIKAMQKNNSGYSR